MKNETREEVFELLKRAAIAMLEDIEAENVIEFGRDPIEREQLVNRIAGITYGELAKEIKQTTNEYLDKISDKINKI